MELIMLFTDTDSYTDTIFKRDINLYRKGFV